MIFDRKPSNWSGHCKIEGIVRRGEASAVIDAVELGNKEIVEILLKHDAENAHLRPRTTLSILYLAFIKGRVDLVKSIVDSLPELLVTARSQFSAYTLETAVVYPGFATFATLSQPGITATLPHSRKNGSTLAAAMVISNTALVEKLLTILPKERLELPIATAPASLQLRIWAEEERTLQEFEGLKPMRTVALQHRADVVIELLKKGTHPNERAGFPWPSGLYPLHFAICVDDAKTAELLI